MLITDFEKKIQAEINPDLIVKQTQKDICGVYLGDICIYVTLPLTEIFEDRRPSHTDDYGVIHRTIDEAMELIPKKMAKILKDMEENPDLFNETYKKLS